MLLLCPWVDLVWFSGLLNYKIDKPNINTFDKWLLKCTTEGLKTNKGKGCFLDIIDVTCWTIWKTRNQASFDHVQPQPHLAIQTIILKMEQLSVINNRKSDRSILEGPSPNFDSWTAPEAPIIKVNIDVS
ncbi:hypothetical protein PRUPE_3G103400 [Prunus persica]|uniref:Uncharacterized protein n=1 Tax=Prunus persica TaxID=3760 RepID=A0A251PYF1_PRUPE|nr:hypothetical protein PRUPE_3G103400 [Prunus persica]